MTTPVVGVVANFDAEGANHFAFQPYLSAVSVHTGAIPIILPCLGGLDAGTFDLHAVLARLDGLLLPGGVTNVHPTHYHALADSEAACFDERRDATALPLIRAAVSEGVPLLAICRGVQELNCAFGGSLHQTVHRLPQRLDHRAPQGVEQHLKYGPAHAVVPSPGGWLHRLVMQASLRKQDLTVNSLHGQAVDRLGVGLRVEARAPDDVIEAISMPLARAFTLGVQWHPEWHLDQSPLNRLIFDHFRAAVGARAGHPPDTVSGSCEHDIV